jgi:ATP-dependent Clp protease ATP-binding subunit ClpA
MLERFTESAKGVLAEAQDLALELGSPSIVPAHLFYGCAEVRDETAGVPLRELRITGQAIRSVLPRQEEQAAVAVDTDALRAIGIDYEAVRAMVERNFGPGALDAAPDRRVPGGPRKPAFTSDAKHALELALRCTIQLKTARIAPGHLVLGLIRLEDELVAAAVEAAGTTVGHVWVAVNASLSATAGGPGRPPAPSRPR